MISVIVPTYNSARFLPNLIASLKAQSISDWECLLVDDGSTDATPTLIASLVATDPRFRSVAKEHSGNPTVSRNRGAAVARGEWLAFLDHDDFWEPNKLAAQLEVAQRYPDVALIHTARTLWRLPTLPDQFRVPAISPAHCRVQTAAEALYHECRITNSSVLIPTALFRKVGGLNERLRAVDDYHLFFKLSREGRIVKIDVPLTYYYWHQGNLSRIKSVMIAGLHAMADEMAREGMPSHLHRRVRAQAFKSEGVQALGDSSSRALGFFCRSLLSFPLVVVWKLAVFAVATSFLPRSARTALTTKLRGDLS